MENHKIKINRAPVLTLWAVVVAERLGYSHLEALTLGKVLAGLNAQSKGQRLGIFTPKTSETASENAQAPTKVKTEETVDLLGRNIPVTHTLQGLRATSEGKDIDPQSVERYLERKFGAKLDETRKAMVKLTEAYDVPLLEKQAFKLYERFRPQVPEGQKGWGAMGELDLDLVASLAKKEQPAPAQHDH